MNIVTKATGDSLTAGEFNQIPDELENLITSGGISPSDLDLQQVAKTIAQYCSDGNFYVASGTANAIILSTNGTRIPPVALTNGFKARFKAVADNTGNCTINVANLGAKSVYFDGNQLQAGEIQTGKFYEVEYDFANDYFVIRKDNYPCVKRYDTLSSLILDTTIRNGDFCVTSGYYSINDGGAGLYKIREQEVSDVENGGTIIFIQNTLVAELVVSCGTINIKQFGAKGDGVSDDTIALQNAMDVAEVLIINTGTYITGSLYLHKNLTILGEINSILKAKANFQPINTPTSLINIKSDYNLTVKNLQIDGNIENQYPDDTSVFGHSLIWCSIGSLNIDNCSLGNTKGQVITTGNVWDFDASLYAHDIYITNCRIIQPSSSGGDCLRIERTRGKYNLFKNNYCFGGASGMRSQLYCRNLNFINNTVLSSYTDVGITAGQSENIQIIGNICSNHSHHGIEIGGVVNCIVSDNTLISNGMSPIFSSESGASIYANDSRFWGSISDTYAGYDNQTYTSPKVSNLHTVITNNTMIDNNNALISVGNSREIIKNNVFINNGTNSYYNEQLSIVRGDLGNTNAIIIDNIFSETIGNFPLAVTGSKFDTIFMNNKSDKILSSNEMNFLGGYNLNENNKYLTDLTKTSGFTLVSDADSPTGTSIEGSANNLIIEIPNISNLKTGFMARLLAKSTSNSSISTTCAIFKNGNWVKTLFSTPISYTQDYKMKHFYIPLSDLEDFDTIKFQFYASGNTLNIATFDVFTRFNDDIIL